jgi:hypothetical protein
VPLIDALVIEVAVPQAYLAPHVLTDPPAFLGRISKLSSSVALVIIRNLTRPTSSCCSSSPPTMDILHAAILLRDRREGDESGLSKLL